MTQTIFFCHPFLGMFPLQLDVAIYNVAAVMNSLSHASSLHPFKFYKNPTTPQTKKKNGKTHRNKETCLLDIVGHSYSF